MRQYPAFLFLVTMRFVPFGSREPVEHSDAPCPECGAPPTYFVNPVTGRESSQGWCDPCFERLFARFSREDAIAKEKMTPVAWKFCEMRQESSGEKLKQRKTERNICRRPIKARKKSAS